MNQYIINYLFGYIVITANFIRISLACLIPLYYREKIKKIARIKEVYIKFIKNILRRCYEFIKEDLDSRSWCIIVFML